MVLIIASFMRESFCITMGELAASCFPGAPIGGNGATERVWPVADVIDDCIEPHAVQKPGLFGEEGNDLFEGDKVDVRDVVREWLRRDGGSVVPTGFVKVKV